MLSQFSTLNANPKAEQRFWAKVAKRRETDCWLWAAGRGRGGYGKFRLDGKHVGAHRAAWILLRGPIPLGMNVLHHCDVRPCVNPAHLYIGDDFDNARDKVTRNRERGLILRNRNATHCPAGHAYEPGNLCGGVLGRKCLTCHRLRAEKARRDAGVPSKDEDTRHRRENRKTHCPQGHAYTPENLYTYKNGSMRLCKTCVRERNRMYREAERSA